MGGECPKKDIVIIANFFSVRFLSVLWEFMDVNVNGGNGAVPPGTMGGLDLKRIIHRNGIEQ